MNCFDLCQMENIDFDLGGDRGITNVIKAPKFKQLPLYLSTYKLSTFKITTYMIETT